MFKIIYYTKKDHQLDLCSSMFSWPKDGCFTKHHSILHIHKTKEITSNKFKTNKHKTISSIHLFIIPVVIWNSQKTVKTNEGNYQATFFSKILSKNNAIQSKLVSEILSNSSLKRTQIKNAWCHRLFEIVI